ncbi:MAG: hypothetical protein NXH75_16620 [Halobacteriovoraceae bacterium]|nr:hypothetical protein [Halobacteriovoraceae bacterium]
MEAQTDVTLCLQLKDLLTSYFRKHPQVSVNGLSKKSGVGASTIRRLMAGEIKGDPAPHTVLNLASSITKEKRLYVLINMFEGPLGEVLKETFAPYIDLALPHSIEKDLNKELQDSIKYFIYKAAANRAGAQESWVLDTFGKLGLDRLGELLEKGFLEKSGEVYHAKEKNFSLDLGIAAAHLTQLVKFYKPHELDKGRNLFYTLSESLNEEAIQKIKDIERNAMKEIYQIMEDENSFGETPYFSLLVSDELTLKQREALQ